MGRGFEARAAHPVQLKSEYPPGKRHDNEHFLINIDLLTSLFYNVKKQVWVIYCLYKVGKSALPRFIARNKWNDISLIWTKCVRGLKCVLSNGLSVFWFDRSEMGTKLVFYFGDLMNMMAALCCIYPL